MSGASFRGHAACLHSTTAPRARALRVQYALNAAWNTPLPRGAAASNLPPLEAARSSAAARVRRCGVVRRPCRCLSGNDAPDVPTAHAMRLVRRLLRRAERSERRAAPAAASSSRRFGMGAAAFADKTSDGSTIELRPLQDKPCVAAERSL